MIATKQVKTTSTTAKSLKKNKVDYPERLDKISSTNSHNELQKASLMLEDKSFPQKIQENKKETIFHMLKETVEKFRSVFVEFAIDWIKDHATIDEARKFEVAGKEKFNSLNKNKLSPTKRKTLTVKKSKDGNRIYFCEDFQQPDGKMTSRSLGTKIPPHIDLSLYSISPKAKELLGL